MKCHRLFHREDNEGPFAFMNQLDDAVKKLNENGLEAHVCSQLEINKFADMSPTEQDSLLGMVRKMGHHQIQLQGGNDGSFASTDKFNEAMTTLLNKGIDVPECSEWAISTFANMSPMEQDYLVQKALDEGYTRLPHEGYYGPFRFMSPSSRGNNPASEQGSDQSS